MKINMWFWFLFGVLAGFPILPLLGRQVSILNYIALVIAIILWIISSAFDTMLDNARNGRKYKWLD